MKRTALLLAGCMAMAGSVLAARPSSPAGNSAATVAALKAEVDTLKGQTELDRRLATLEGKAAAENLARDNLSKYLSFFGWLITFFALVSSIASYILAGARATQEAEKQLKDKKDAVDALVKQAQMAAASAVKAEADATATLAAVKAMTADIAEKSATADQHLAKIRDGAATADELVKASAAGGKSEATPAQKRSIEAAVAQNAGTPEDDWSIDQFKSAIGKALYVDDDDERWNRAAKWAARMQEVHGADDEASAYAMNRMGDSEQRRRKWPEARAAYSSVIKRFSENLLEELRDEVAWARYHIGLVSSYLGNASEAYDHLTVALELTSDLYGIDAPDTMTTRRELASAILNLGRSAEAEASLRDLLSSYERIVGPDNLATLLTRHLLARAILDQGRAPEAEKLFRNLLPMLQRLKGADAPATLVSRYCWADALVRAGNPQRAARELNKIPDPVTHAEWLPLQQASLSFVRGRVADAVSKPKEASQRLADAMSVFAENCLPDHFRRRELNEYIAGRKLA